MKEVSYRDFSAAAHDGVAEAGRPSVAQFELTFRCAFHCRHCYTDCYNAPRFLKKELGTEEVRRVLRKLRRAGIVWLCLTGGDPLARRDFFEIYASARAQGFLITVFTTGSSLTEAAVRRFQKMPPFSLEVTLNTVSPRLFEKMYGRRGAFASFMRGIERSLAAKLPLKVKTLLTRDNISALAPLKKFLRKRGLPFEADAMLQPRLDGDASVCRLRIAPDEARRFFGEEVPAGKACAAEEGREALFPCVVSAGHEIDVDPYGRMFLCQLIRTPSIDVVTEDVLKGREALVSFFRRGYATDSACRSCAFAHECRLCPGFSFLEKKDFEAPVEYFCELAKAR